MRRNLYKITHNKDLHVGVNKINFSHRRHDTVSRRQSLHGFTLVELLVVISIIALLLAILMPSLQKVREQAKMIACLSNQRQVGIAMNMYLAENEDTFYEYLEGSGISPAYRECGQGGIPFNENDWRPLNEYVKTYEVWKCPSDKGRVMNLAHTPPFGEFPGGGRPTWDTPKTGSSYVFNWFGIAKIRSGSGSLAALNYNPNVANKAANIKMASNFVLFSEHSLYEVNEGVDPSSEDWVAHAGYGFGGAWNYHERLFEPTTATAAFMDGHAEHLRGFTGKGNKTTEFRIVAEWLK